MTLEELIKTRMETTDGYGWEVLSEQKFIIDNLNHVREDLVQQVAQLDRALHKHKDILFHELAPDLSLIDQFRLWCELELGLYERIEIPSWEDEAPETRLILQDCFRGETWPLYYESGVGDFEVDYLCHNLQDYEDENEYRKTVADVLIRFFMKHKIKSLV